MPQSATAPKKTGDAVQLWYDPKSPEDAVKFTLEPDEATCTRGRNMTLIRGQ